MTDKARRYVEETVAYLEKHYSEPLKSADLAARLGISRSYLARLMQEYSDLSVMEWLRNIRLEHGHEMLLSTDKSITEIARNVGYRDPAAFSKYFRDRYGTSPSDYRSLHSNSKKSPLQVDI